MHKYLNNWHAEEGIDLFSHAPEGRTRTSNWNRLWHGNRLKLDIRRNFLMGRASNWWYWLTCEVIYCIPLRWSSTDKVWIAICPKCFSKYCTKQESWIWLSLISFQPYDSLSVISYVYMLFNVNCVYIL